MSSDTDPRDFEDLSTVADQGQVGLNEAQRMELQHRLVGYRSGSTRTSPWVEVRERLRRKS